MSKLISESDSKVNSRCIENYEGGAGCDTSFPCYHHPSICIRKPTTKGMAKTRSSIARESPENWMENWHKETWAITAIKPLPKKKHTKT